MTKPLAMMAAVVALGTLPAAGAPADPLAALQWHARVLLVIAPDQHDPKLAQQRTAFAAMQSGARDRNLKLVEAIGSTSEAQALRHRFDIADTGFHALLIGKDGGSKLAADEPLRADQLFPLIDAMPMQQEEKRRRS